MILGNLKQKLFLVLSLLVFISSAVADLVPKKIHFIWMGKNIPAEYIDNIRSFAARNPDYELNLWFESPSRFNQTFARMDGAAFKFKFRNLSEIISEMSPQMQALFTRERVGLYPNFAAASDILRLYLLYKEGGVYLDTDIRATEDLSEKKRPQGFGQLEAKNGLLYNVWFEPDCHFPRFNNNLVAGIPGAASIKSLIDEMQIRYSTADPEVLWQGKREPAPQGIDPVETVRFGQTLFLSGPILFKHIFYKELFESFLATLSPEQGAQLLKLVGEVSDDDMETQGVRVNSIVGQSQDFWKSLKDGVRIKQQVQQIPKLDVDDKCDHTWCIRAKPKERQPSVDFQ